MQAGVSESHFVATTSYGYGDRRRDVLDAVYAYALGAEDALCRYNFVSGTHTLTVALFGVLRPGDTMLSVTGMPYDTLQGRHRPFGRELRLSEGIRRKLRAGRSSARRHARLCGDGNGGHAALPHGVYPALARVQPAPVAFGREIGRIAEIAKRRAPGCIVMVDNCYGEYVQKIEPTAVGADLMAGSLIKNRAAASRPPAATSPGAATSSRCARTA